MGLQHRDGTGFLSQRSSVDSGGWVLVMMLALIVRFYDISLPYFWTDEAFSALVGVQSPERIWFHLGHDVHPPLYFLILHAWMSVFGEGVVAIRALSALAGVATVALGVWLMRLITSVATSGRLTKNLITQPSSQPRISAELASLNATTSWP